MGRLKLGRKIKNLGKKAGKGIKNVTKAIGSEIKETGTDVKKKVERVGKASERLTKKTGRKIKNVAKKVVSEVKETGTDAKKKVQRVGRATERFGKNTDRKVKNVAKTTGRVVRRNTQKVLNISDFNLKLHFKICHSKRKFSDVEVENWIEERIALAQKLFAMKPSLRLSYTFSRVKNGAGLLEKSFPKGADYNRFMNDFFDNQAKSITKGSLVFLVVNRWVVSTKRFKKGEMRGLCGKAFFPYYSGWRKHAIVLQKSNTCGVDVFSHELGHIFGLHHTFEKAGICTRNYPKTKGGTNKNNQSNLMDYKRASKVYLNDCQERTAALFRRRYMTINGKVNYLKLKGIL